jgi:hypothetical protein
MTEENFGQQIDISFLADLECKNIEILIGWCTRLFAEKARLKDIEDIKETLAWWASEYQKYMLVETPPKPGENHYCYKPAASVAQFEELLSLTHSVGAPAVHRALVYGQHRLHFADKVFAEDLGL